MFLRTISTSVTAQTRYPALWTRISKNAHERNLQKIQFLKQKLGDKYRQLGREKRTSPPTERRSPSKPSQLVLPPKTPSPITRVMAFQTKPPKDIVGDLKQDLKPVEEAKEESKQETRSILMPQFSQEVKEQQVFDLSLKPNAVPQDETNSGVRKGPYYRFGLKPTEAKFLFETLPKNMQKHGQEDKLTHEQQAEMVRRILDLSLSNESDLKHFNKSRVKELFQKHEQDTGSPSVQAAALTVRIEALEAHLQKNKKDKSSKRRLQAIVSRRRLVLKYLRRKDLKQFVDTCHSLGVDPVAV
ncbi:hypothetical protein EDD86DRAFT_193453 [Gorgonomyces haynaldii]|nr:hypothetical protein EDD86DRAFT_193453 [Gorgonomyces haynaldii]